MHGRSRTTISPRIPTMPGRSTSGFHQPGRHCLHQARSAVRCSASRMKGKLRGGGVYNDTYNVFDMKVRRNLGFESCGGGRPARSGCSSLVVITTNIWNPRELSCAFGIHDGDIRIVTRGRRERSGPCLLFLLIEIPRLPASAHSPAVRLN